MHFCNEKIVSFFYNITKSTFNMQENQRFESKEDNILIGYSHWIALKGMIVVEFVEERLA